ncbi:MAG TPA: PKD domain-containing protein, partial [Thermoanaerobaculia bacterium]
ALGYTPYQASVSYSYTVRPFVPSIQLVTTSPTATNLVFQNTTRIADFSTNAHFSKGAATPVKIQWSITTATGTTNAPLRTTTLGAVATDQYTILKSSITVGSKVTMTLTISTPADVVAESCRTTAFTTASAEMLLNPPDPDVLTASGCLYTNGPCSVSVRSFSGASRSSWTYQWLVDDSQVLGATGETFSPVFTTPGNHSVKVRATNVIGTTTSAAVTYAITTPPCAGAPANVTFAFSGTVSGCLANCPANEPIKFTPRSFGYSFQECDTFKWEVLNDNRVFETREPTITFAQNGTYSVRLTVTNSNGSASTTSQLQIGDVVIPPPCQAPPSRINITFSGSAGCQVGGTCYEGDSILFTPVNGTLGNYNFLACPDSFSWNLGSNGVSGEMSPRRTFSAGTYTITLRVSNSGGGTDALPVTLVVLPQTPINNCPLPPSSYLSISWTGPNNCSFGGISCRYGEQITFTANAFFPGFKGCETFAWDFGDGTPPGSGRVTTHAYATTANAKNTVTLTVRNEFGEQIIRTAEMNLAGSPIAVPTNASFTVSGTAIAGKPVTFVGSATSAAPITAWEWEFGDGTPKGSGQNVTHTYANSGSPRVTLVARNEGGPSAPYSNTIEVKPRNQFAFLLPVVAHLTGQLSSQWRTDLQIFNPDPGFVPASPMELTLEFRGTTGVTKEVSIDSATYIHEDLYRLFFPTGDGAGTVLVSGNAPYAPQMWTRTYNQSASGVGTFGQLIPAIRLTDFPNAVTETSTYIMAGLENSARYRTNLGLVNPTNEVQTITVKAIDDSPFGLPLGNFTETVNPYSLAQIGNLTTRIPALATGKRYSLNLKTQSGAPLVGYASMIDNRSGDPAYIPAIEADALKGDYEIQLLPGVGRVGSWRSDVTIYNAGEATFLNLSYYSAAGAKAGEANAIPLAANAFIQINDLLHSSIWPSPIPDTVGALQVETSMSGIDEKYPVVFAQTYNDQGEKGTYGQGITGFAASQPNAKLGAIAYIPGIRSDLAYYTNLGLTNVTDKVTKVKVSLLDAATGHPIGEKFYELQPNQSLIDSGTPDKRGVVPALSATAFQGTLKIDVFEGGSVWAFASIVDRTTFDPEYVPAIPAPSN